MTRKKTPNGQQPTQLPALQSEARHVEHSTSALFPSVSKDSLVDDEADSFPSDFPRRPAYVRKVAKSYFDEDLYGSNESLSQVHGICADPCIYAHQSLFIARTSNVYVGSLACQHSCNGQMFK